MRIVIFGVATLLCVACNNRQDVQCQQSGACDLSSGGVCETAPTGNRWCAYPDPECPGGYRYSSQDIGDGLGGMCVPAETGSDAGINTRTLTVNVGGSGAGVVTSTPNGIACSGGTCTMTFAVGAQVSLGQSATAGTFLGWSGGCVGPGACSITLDHDQIVSALFGMPGEALWSTQIGGAQDDGANGVAADSDGNLIVVGTFKGSFAVGQTTLTSSGGADIFVAKILVADGSIAWIKSFGEAGGDDTARRVALDASNNIYIVGNYFGTLSFGTDSITSAGSDDGFTLALDPSGGYRWAKSLGGQFHDAASGIAVQGTTVAVVGSYAGSMTVNNQTVTNAGSLQAFLVEFGTDGSAGSVKTITGTGQSSASKVAFGTGGMTVIAGDFSGTSDFGGGNVASQAVDTFLAAYTSGGAYIFAKALGGTSNDSEGTLAISPTGYILFTGAYVGSVPFGGASPIDAGTGGLVVVSYSLAGAYQWAKVFGGSSANQAVATDVAVNASGDSVIAGYFCGSVSFGTQMVSSVGTCSQHDDDIFAARLSGADGTPLTVSRAGGSMQDEALGVAQAADGKHYVVGTFQGFADFGGVARTSAGGTDAIVVGLAPL